MDVNISPLQWEHPSSLLFEKLMFLTHIQPYQHTTCLNLIFLLPHTSMVPGTAQLASVCQPFNTAALLP